MRLEAVAEVGGIGVDVGEFAPVGFVDWSRGDCEINRCVHVVPPEEFGDGEGGVAAACFVPELRALNERAGLFPELYFGKGAVVPAVGHDAVLRDGRAGQDGGLGSAGDGGERGAEKTNAGGRGEGTQTRRLREQRLGEANDEDDGGSLHGCVVIDENRAT